MRSRAMRKHQAQSHMMRRLKEDRNQHYWDLACPCWGDKKAMARFKEQPKLCSCYMCGNSRRWEGPTMQERKANGAYNSEGSGHGLLSRWHRKV